MLAAENLRSQWQESIVTGWIDRSDELNNQADARARIAEAYRLAGRRDKAVAALEEALARYQQKGNLVMTGWTRAQLDELSGASA